MWIDDIVKIAINLTPHQLAYYYVIGALDGYSWTTDLYHLLPASGNIAHSVSDIPPKRVGIFYIVTRELAKEILDSGLDREDVYYPCEFDIRARYNECGVDLPDQYGALIYTYGKMPNKDAIGCSSIANCKKGNRFLPYQNLYGV